MTVRRPAPPARSSPGRRVGRPDPGPRRLVAALGRVMAYQRPFRRRVADDGLVAVAPASVGYALLTLVVSALWLEPTAGHRAVAACCAWRAADLPQSRLLPVLGSALLVRRPVEAVWTVLAVWLLLGPLEALVGSHRLLLLGALGHVVSTVAVDLCWLATGRPDTSLAGLDVGTSAVVVTATAALAVGAGSLPLALALATGLAVDLATSPNLASVEHLVAAAVGVAAALTLRPGRRRRRPVPSLSDP
jgi:membrane associated rhomboid family serine protease